MISTGESFLVLKEMASRAGHYAKANPLPQTDYEWVCNVVEGMEAGKKVVWAMIPLPGWQNPNE